MGVFPSSSPSQGVWNWLRGCYTFSCNAELTWRRCGVWLYIMYKHESFIWVWELGIINLSELFETYICILDRGCHTSIARRKAMVHPECVHYGDVITGAIASQMTSLTIVYSTVYSDADQRKRQSSASLAFVWGIHWGPVNSPQKWPVTRKMFPFDDVIMLALWSSSIGEAVHILWD